jgi:DNA-binding NarL/FixJ family response regulator
MRGSLITVMLVDDHSVVRAGYRSFLNDTARIKVVCEASTGEEACLHYQDLHPRVVVMDLNLPGIGGLAATRRLVARDPSARILIFSMFDEMVYVNRAFEAGARGYITKSGEPELLVEAVMRIAGNETFIEPEIARKLDLERLVKPKGATSVLEGLSAREFDVFCLLAKGQSTREISEALKISFKTASNYATNIKIKLNLKTNGELVLLANELVLDETLQKRASFD